MKALWEQYGWLGIPLLLFLLYLPQIAPTVTTTYGGADGGELASAIWLGAVPHPPGYPTYLLFGRVALFVPWGEPAWRLGILSSLSIATSAALFGAATLTAHKMPASQRLNWVGGACTALVLGLNPRLITQALIVEVYPLALSFLGMLMWLTARQWRWNQRRTAAAIGLVLGLGLGIQLPILAWGLAFGSAAIIRRQGWEWRSIRLVGSFAVLGVSVYSVLFWRGKAQPTFSWGDWTTLRGAWEHITASEYQYLSGIVPWSQRLARLSFAIRDLVTGLGGLGTGLALVGLVGAHTLAGWRTLSAISALATLAWAISYGGADSEAYLLPLHALGALWAGHGMLHLLTIPQNHGLKKGIVMLGLLLMLLPPQRLIKHSLRTATAERDAALQRITQQPQNASISTTDDRETFPLWYVQRVLGVRPDVTIIDLRLKERRWYQGQ